MNYESDIYDNEIRKGMLFLTAGGSDFIKVVTCNISETEQESYLSTYGYKCKNAASPW